MIKSERTERNLRTFAFCISFLVHAAGSDRLLPQIRKDQDVKEYAKSFYKSHAWKQTREEYARSVGYLCERCLAKGVYRTGEIVHHKIYLTPDNISDTTISLSWDNLELVCRECHAELHEARRRRWKVDAAGRVVSRGD